MHGLKEYRNPRRACERGVGTEKNVPRGSYSERRRGICFSEEFKKKADSSSLRSSE